MSEYLQAFPKETRDDIAERFKAYFAHKKSNRLTYRDAKKLIDHVSGPAPLPKAVGAINYSKTPVSGGGTVRPTDKDIVDMMGKYECESDDPWNAVFDEIIRRHQWNPDNEKLIYLAFKDRLSDASICEELNIGRTTYFTRKKELLQQIGVIAVDMGVLNPWKY